MEVKPLFKSLNTYRTGLQQAAIKVQVHPTGAISYGWKRAGPLRTARCVLGAKTLARPRYAIGCGGSNLAAAMGALR